MDRTIHEFADPPRRENPREESARSPVGDNKNGARIGVIYNPRSHRNKGQDLDRAMRPGVMVAQPERREEIRAALAEFAGRGLEYLVINGGDGTVRDVLTAGADVFGDAWPQLAVVPKGKTNALNVDLGAPADWSLADAVEAYETGKRVMRRPLDIVATGREGAPLRGFILGAGAFTLGTSAGQDAHRLGFFDSLAVGLISAWSVMQAMFGSDSNPWRRGVEMSIRLEPSGEPLAHSKHGDPARREIILATTLRRMPLGIKPFGKERDGLKLGVMDKPRRRLLAALPAVLAGWESPWLAKTGLHRVDAEAFTLDIADQFILDGEAFPAGSYRVGQGPELTFVTG